MPLRQTRTCSSWSPGLNSKPAECGFVSCYSQKQLALALIRPTVSNISGTGHPHGVQTASAVYNQADYGGRTAETKTKRYLWKACPLASGGHTPFRLFCGPWRLRDSSIPPNAKLRRLTTAHNNMQVRKVTYVALSGGQKVWVWAFGSKTFGTKPANRQSVSSLLGTCGVRLGARIRKGAVAVDAAGTCAGWSKLDDSR